MPKPVNNRGFSLLEGIASIGILTLVLVVVTQVFIANQVIVARALARADDDNGASLTIRRMGELVRGAYTVLNTYLVNGTRYSTGAYELVVQIPAIDAEGSVFPGEYDFIAIYRDDTDTTQIWSDTMVSEDSARIPGKKLLTDHNDTLEFSFNDPDPAYATRLSVFLVNAQAVRGVTIQTKAWTSIYLRNR